MADFSIKELIDDYGSVEELPEVYKKAIDKGMELYRISADNDSYGVELALYNMAMNYISEELIMESDNDWKLEQILWPIVVAVVL